jgi:hypothetical protein
VHEGNPHKRWVPQDGYQFFLEGIKHQVNSNNPINETDILTQSSKLAKTKIVEWPGTFQNFQLFSTQMVICCWANVKDSTNNADVYQDDNCAPCANQIKGRFYMYPEESEGSVNCCRFTFGTD